jgi:hypothetical protein
VRFVGRPPIIPNQAPLPLWAHEFDGSRKVVLVTQGTLANHNFGLLIAPTLAALANQPDLLVVATAGRSPRRCHPWPIPANARLSQYLPFDGYCRKSTCSSPMAVRLHTTVIELRLKWNGHDFVAVTNISFSICSRGRG